MPDFGVDEVSVWLSEVILQERMNLGEVSIIFCSDDYLLDINKKYLDHNYFTDVITFDYTEGDIVSGDLFISIVRVKDNSEQLGVDFGLELRRIMVHGVLHLLGYVDKSDEERQNMTVLENKYLGL